MVKMSLVMYMFFISLAGRAQESERSAFKQVKPDGRTVYVFEFTAEEVVSLRIKVRSDSLCTKTTLSLQDSLMDFEIQLGSKNQRIENLERDYERQATELARDKSKLEDYNREGAKQQKKLDACNGELDKTARKLSRANTVATVFGIIIGVEVIAGVVAFIVY